MTRARRRFCAWLKSRWREENFLKYASENYGIDKICDYIAGIETNTKIVDNPARKAASGTVREAEKTLAAAERDWPACWQTPAISPAAKNTRLIPAAQKKITARPQGPGRRHRRPRQDPREAARQ